jgi:hypothetical protein
MHIKRLARKAVFITAAVMVLVGFSTGIAGTASAAPTSHVSAVASGGTPAVPHMPAQCGNNFCTLGLSTRGEYIIQVFRCSPHGTYHGIRIPIYGMQNNCSFRVYYFNPGTHCVSPHSSQAGVGRFGNVDEIFVSTNPSHC